MDLSQIPVGKNPPDDVNVVVEIPVGGQPIKYEIDKKAGVLVVDRFLYTPMVYPGNYGFIPNTLGDDGDPLDVIICNDRPLVSGSVINVRPVGMLLMEDNAGLDEKILAVPSPHLTRKFENIDSFAQLPEITLRKIEHFFQHYKDLEPDKWSKIGVWQDAEAARRLIKASIEKEASANGNPG